MPKTPDEIKKGLECRIRSYRDTCDHKCDTCDLWLPAYSIYERYEDALAFIRQLEAELEDMTARYKIADDCAKKKGEMNEKIYAELAAIKAEQDATMNFLRNGGCETCLYGDYDGSEPPCINCTAERDLWQWKGMQKKDLS